MGFFEKLGQSLKKTRDSIFGAIGAMVTASEITDEMYDNLEEQLILADVGADVAMDLVDQLRREVKANHLKTGPEAMQALKGILCKMMSPEEEMHLSGQPTVILVIGVNGVGKTTSIAKLAKLYTSQGKKVMLAAGDTFRAAAAEQLGVWADRVGVTLVRHSEGSDPAAVIYDAVESAAARHCDIVICDTAGRLHNKKNLMEELKKIKRVIDREYPEAFRETLVVLDATTGQNALAQAKEFNEVGDITGVILTKMDGTAKGGIAVAIQSELGIPVKYIGIGEKIDDLQKFNANDFVNALFHVQK